MVTTTSPSFTALAALVAMTAAAAAAVPAARAREVAPMTAAAVSVPLYSSPNPFQYFVAGVLGQAEEKQTFRLLFDTERSFLAVPSGDCVDCGHHPSLPYERTGSFVPVGCGEAPGCTACARDDTECQFEAEYEDPSNANGTAASTNSFEGIVGYETLHLGDVAALNVPFAEIVGESGPWAANAGTQVDGVFGLGLRGLSCHPYCTSSLVEALDLEASAYGFCFRQGPTGPEGVLDLASVNASRHQGEEMVYVDEADETGPSSVAVKFSALRVGDAEVGGDAAAAVPAAVLDTSTPYLHLPSTLYDAVRAALKAAAPPGYESGSNVFDLGADGQTWDWPSVTVELPNRHDGAPASVTISAEQYLFPLQRGGATVPRHFVLGIHNAAVTRAHDPFLVRAVTLGAVWADGQYVVVRAGTGSSKLLLGVAKARHCPPSGEAPPRSNGGLPPRGECTDCEVGPSTCGTAFQAGSQSQCDTMISSYLPFDSTPLPEGCRATFDAWVCGSLEEVSKRAADAECAAPGDGYRVPPLCKESCDKRNLQLTECAEGDVVDSLGPCSHHQTADCLNVTVPNPFESGSCVECSLSYCTKNSERTVFAGSEEHCTALQKDSVSPGLPVRCRPLWRDLKCQEFSAASKILKESKCGPTTPWERIELCQKDCDAFVDELRECAGDEYDALVWDNHCQDSPKTDCISLSEEPTDGGEGACYPCHIGLCPGSEVSAANEEQCEKLQALTVGRADILGGGNCTTRVESAFCSVFRGFGEFVEGHKCAHADEVFDLCFDACELIRDDISECVKPGVLNQTLACNATKPGKCISQYGAVVDSKGAPGGGDSGGGQAKWPLVVLGIVIAAAVVLAAVIGRYYWKRRRESAAGAEAYTVVGDTNEPML